MIFGIPWFAIIPIVAIVGGLLFAYKEQELKLEEKRLGRSRELNEMRKIIHNLKGRIEHLEMIVNDTVKKQKSSLGSIEIDDEVDSENFDNESAKSRRSSTKN